MKSLYINYYLEFVLHIVVPSPKSATATYFLFSFTSLHRQSSLPPEIPVPSPKHDPAPSL